ncbi:MAG: enoyl-[acyl-carrier-protein] reductase FabK [Clostridia bacterium]|nr:enoyl-[acyl-carrier-protein] reductase FabK [Clostridia bacterium]
MLRTRICEILGIDYPIFQGGMAWIATGRLAGAVSEAGGLGIIGAGSAPPEVVKKEIDKVREITDKPFAVNVYYISPHLEEIIRLMVDERVPVITTGGGNPGKHIESLKKADIKVFPVVSSVALAKRLARTGVDGLIAEGMECGGHIGDIATMPLIPQIVDAVDIPVVAAGGIADGRGLAAALALGAEGIQMGTRFICAEECTVHSNYKDAIIRAKDRDTTTTGYSGHYVRVLKNKLVRAYERLGQQGTSPEDLEELGSGKLQLAALNGDVDNGSVMAGQVAALVDGIKPAGEIIDEIIVEARDTVEGLEKLFSKGG